MVHWLGLFSEHGFAGGTYVQLYIETLWY
jgi:hypothetical protein